MPNNERIFQDTMAAYKSGGRFTSISKEHFFKLIQAYEAAKTPATKQSVDSAELFEKEWPELFEHCKGQIGKWDISPTSADKFAWHHVAMCGFQLGLASRPMRESTTLTEEEKREAVKVMLMAYRPHPQLGYAHQEWMADALDALLERFDLRRKG
jgi:hypothetical protein